MSTRKKSSKSFNFCLSLTWTRGWYFLRQGETEAPPEVIRIFDVVAGALRSAADIVRPGVQGWEVDAVARNYIVEAGFPEYPHALGHSKDRYAPDGGTGFIPAGSGMGRSLLAGSAPIRSSPWNWGYAPNLVISAWKKKFWSPLAGVSGLSHRKRRW